VNYFLEPPRIAGIMKEAGARALIADDSLFPDIWPRSRRSTPSCLKVSRVAGQGQATAGVIDFESTLVVLPRPQRSRVAFATK
jgi:hypothetical protein